MKACHACHKELTLRRSIGRRDICPSCGADLHSCLNCSFYDRSVSKECREPGAEYVKEKSRANFCDFFRFAEKGGAGGADSPAEQARKALDDLFKK